MIQGQVTKKPLLSTKNTKTIKGEKLGYLTYILYMSAFTQNSLGKNVCSHASKGCAESCLVGSGHGGMIPMVAQGRINRTEYFLRDRVGFFNQLRNEVEKAIKKNEGKAIVTFRLNGTSDIAYEKFKVFEGKNIFELFPDIQFYDYTKNHLRFKDTLPTNYHLTFSRSETKHDKAIEILKKGYNVAMVFTSLPKTYLGYEVIDGDENDLRFKDKKNVIVGLKYKKMTGKGADNTKAIKSGFVIDTTNIDEVMSKYNKKIDKFSRKNLVVVK